MKIKKKIISKGGCLFIDDEHIIIPKEKSKAKVLLGGLCIAYMEKFNLKEEELFTEMKNILNCFNEFIKGE